MLFLYIFLQKYRKSGENQTWFPSNQTKKINQNLSFPFQIDFEENYFEINVKGSKYNIIKLCISQNLYKLVELINKKKKNLPLRQPSPSTKPSPIKPSLHRHRKPEAPMGSQTALE